MSMTSLFALGPNYWKEKVTLEKVSLSRASRRASLFDAWCLVHFFYFRASPTDQLTSYGRRRHRRDTLAQACVSVFLAEPFGETLVEFSCLEICTKKCQLSMRNVHWHCSTCIHSVLFKPAYQFWGLHHRSRLLLHTSICDVLHCQCMYVVLPFRDWYQIGPQIHRSFYFSPIFSKRKEN